MILVLFTQSFFYCSVCQNAEDLIFQIIWKGIHFELDLPVIDYYYLYCLPVLPQKHETHCN